MLWFSDGVYRGETEKIVQGAGKKEMRHGLGIMIYAKRQDGPIDYQIYEGFWFKDQKHGQGYERYSNKDQY